MPRPAAGWGRHPFANDSGFESGRMCDYPVTAGHPVIYCKKYVQIKT
ncbi:hypothetical protein SXCC_03096 [Gluconacetobacter sp. SXCC-1]|nr:hypothetical protein SXCC_03096 [Gluconacetobacter sp. SXCC-1]